MNEQLPTDQNDNQQNNRPEYPISGRDVVVVVIITLLILFAGFILISAIGALEVLNEEGGFSQEKIEQWTGGDLQSLPLSIKLSAMFVQLLLIIPAWIFIRKRRLSVPVYLRLKPVPVSLLGYALMIGLGIAVLGDEISRLVNYILPLPEDFAAGLERMMRLRSFEDFITMGITVAVVAPVVEEMLFRGFFQRYFEAKRGVTSGVMIASALFAAYHFNIYWLIPILLLATVMGAMAWRAESIWPTIVVHATNNTIGLVAANVYTENDPDWYLMGDHVNPLVLIVALVLFIVGIRQFFKVAETRGLGGHRPAGEPVTQEVDQEV